MALKANDPRIQHFVPDLPIASIQGADYNPRRISPEAFEKLKESMGLLGIIKPILVNAGTNIIIAGHQRTKAMKAVGATTTTAMMLRGINLADEKSFNQLHNASDINFGDIHIQVDGIVDQVGYQWVEWHQIRMDRKVSEVPGASERQAMLGLMVKHGNWGSAVVDRRGNILISKQYAMCARIMKFPLLIYVVPDEHVRPVLELFKLDYGVYDYNKMKRETFNQAHCSFYRETGKGRDRNSGLYEKHVYPNVEPEMNILDFGSGYKENPTRLASKGYNVWTLEFFEKLRGSHRLNLVGFERDFNKLTDFIASGKRFDMVICDVVLSACDSQQAEDDVMHSIHFFCKMGGLMGFSGRTLESVAQRQRAKKYAGHSRGVEFLDEFNISATQMAGTWVYQKFHGDKERNALCQKYVSESDYVITRHNSGWQAFGRKSIERPIEDVKDAVSREFNMPWPNGGSVNKHREMIAAIEEWESKVRSGAA